MVKRNIVLVLGDQLSLDLSALKAADKSQDVVIMAEVHDEGTYVKHHKKKIVLILAAMRKFAQELRDQGWQVAYTTLDDPNNAGSITGELLRRAAEFEATRVVATEPGEFRLIEALASAPLTVEVLQDDRFLSSHAEFEAWAKGRRALRMEYFYRDMRRKTGLLMDGDQPEGGKWNYDAENRKPAQSDLFRPEPLKWQACATTRAVTDLVNTHFPDHPGSTDGFWFATDRKGAEEALAYFLAHNLKDFGDYQDAMLEDDAFLHHSLLSAYINIGLLDPLDVCQRVEEAYKSGNAPLNAVEGFIRQIIGWREYMRGIYFHEGPDYTARNFLKADRDLPEFYWTAETEMNCLTKSIGQTLEEAYAHHIQRLMVIGNFALLAGIDPKQVHEWFLAIYWDAFEWVEAPNVIGMSQFADAGVIASKPYVSSGAYIDRMSDYCKNCAYSVKKKTGEGACPFNLLYWDFLDRNEDVFAGNHRMSQIYANWRRRSNADKDQIREEAKAFLDTL